MQERSVIDVNTETETRKVSKRSTKLAMHCSETLNNKVYIIGGYYTRKYIHYIGKNSFGSFFIKTKLNSFVDDRQCNIKRHSITLPIDYMRHTCAVHNERIFMCGTYRDSVRCDR